MGAEEKRRFCFPASVPPFILTKNITVPNYIVAVAAIIVRDGKVLAMRRAADKDAGAGLWETLSGRVELGEEPLDAVRREIAEECGLAVRLEPRPLTVYHAKRNDEPMMVIVYRAHYGSGEVVMSDEHDDYGWVTAEDFAKRSTLAKLVNAVEQAFSDPH